MGYSTATCNYRCFQVQLLRNIKKKTISQPFVPYGYTSKIKPNDNIAQSEAGDQNKEASPSNRQVDTETAEQITWLRERLQKLPVQSWDNNNFEHQWCRSTVTKVNGEIKNALKILKMLLSIKKQSVGRRIRNLASISTSMSSNMIKSTFDNMAPMMNEGLHKIYKEKYGLYWQRQVILHLQKLQVLHKTKFHQF